MMEEEYDQDIKENIECDDDDPDLYITDTHIDDFHNINNNFHNDSSKKYRRSKKGFSSEDDSFSSDPESETGLHSSSLGNELSAVRGLPVGAAADHTDYTDGDMSFMKPKGPQRIFKVVFIGDSGVGKSSFIHRFCNDTFKDKYAATIGVDFQIKTVEQDDNIIALQLWDTAGQERFRSITKQYFRKADGIIVMYDVTSETSFTNIRNWMLSVQDGVDDGTVLVIVGNKIDLIAEKNSGVVSSKVATKLADEYGALFFETSAKSAGGIPETIDGLVSLLKEKEDKALEAALHLDDLTVKKKKCCGK